MTPETSRPSPVVVRVQAWTRPVDPVVESIGRLLAAVTLITADDLAGARVELDRARTLIDATQTVRQAA